mmetsp:Transcript_126475/g.404029  ORF Transcript_126475/g.404029 Transcript_126475/m.404029 type:complete len:274 (-) Transcript_126475:126-947(-)
MTSVSRVSTSNSRPLIRSADEVAQAPVAQARTSAQPAASSAVDMSDIAGVNKADNRNCDTCSTFEGVMQCAGLRGRYTPRAKAPLPTWTCVCGMTSFATDFCCRGCGKTPPHVVQGSHSPTSTHHEVVRPELDSRGRPPLVAGAVQKPEHHGTPRHVAGAFQHPARDLVMVSEVASRESELEKYLSITTDTAQAKAGNILQCMKKDESSATVQEQACEYLYKLGGQDLAVRHTITNSGGVRIIVEAMDRHSRVVGLQLWGCCALRALVTREAR